MQNYLRKRREAGFTLIELLIVIAIIGIIATILIPELLDALQKAKQKETVGEMDSVGTAMMAWVTDEAGAAAAGSTFATWTPGNFNLLADAAALAAEISLDPDSTIGQVEYIQEVPALDGWGNEFVYYLDIVNPLAQDVAAIYSCGRQDVAGPCTPAGDTDPVTPFFANCYQNDIIWANGDFISYPVGKLRAEAIHGVGADCSAQGVGQ